MNLGGLGLCLASGGAEAAHWACWADCIPSVKRRHPDVAEARQHSCPTTQDHECANTLRESEPACDDQGLI